ncbi:hypothetical protein FHR88_004838 [Bradyrhizobium betae]|nr:hypothetical protein [Bradyrhizobium betae]
MKEGAGKTGCRPGTHGPLCERWQQESAQRHTGEAKHPAFPAQWLYGLCHALPGERCTLAPVALRMTDARVRLDHTHHHKAWRQPAGARTTRFCRTQITPVVRAMCLAHGCPPCDHRRTSVTHVHRRPARVRDDRDTPLFVGPECAQYPPIPNFCKGEYFWLRGLTDRLGVLPVGQHKGLRRRVGKAKRAHHCHMRSPRDGGHASLCHPTDYGVPANRSITRSSSARRRARRLRSR